VTATKIPQTDQDKTFREDVLDLIRNSRSSVQVIAGELGSYDFPELREAAHDAAARGVKIDVYANEPRPEVIAHLRNAGAHIVVGNLRAWHHYLVVDGKTVIVSLKHGHVGPTKTGTREGVLHRDDPSLASGVAAYLRFLEDASGRASPAEVLSNFVREVGAHPTLARRIPFAENVFSLLGLDADEALALGRTMVDALSVDTADTREALKEGDLATLISNEVALATAATQLHARSDANDWNFPFRGSNEPLHASDVEMALTAAKLRVRPPTTSSRH
jgi:hypothetical protein